MNTDIRIAVSFKTHRKRKRLRMLLGPGATDYLLDLWIATAMNHPTGVLAGMDEVDIALEAGWEDDPRRFVAALEECGFLDMVDGTYALHDWGEHQAYAVKAPDRKAAARHAASRRWAEKRGVAPVEPGRTGGQVGPGVPGGPKGPGTPKGPGAPGGPCGSHADGMPGAVRNGHGGNAPLPAPSPDPVPVPGKDSSLRSESSCSGSGEPDVLGESGRQAASGREERQAECGAAQGSASRSGGRSGTRSGARPKSRSKPDLPEDSEAHRLAVFMRDELRRALPTFTPPDIQAWAREFDVALRNDARYADVRFVARVIRWVANDEFWRCNCQSPGKLRKQFDQLTARMEREAAKARDIPAGGYGGSPAERRLEANKAAMRTFIDGAPV